MTILERILELACRSSIAGFSQDTVLFHTPADAHLSNSEHVHHNG